MQHRLLALVVLVLMALGVWAFFLFFEQHEYEVETPYSKAARSNPFLAAKRFMEKNGVKVIADSNEIDFDKITPKQTVLLSQVDSMLLTTSQIDKAIDWVSQGGHLLIGVGREVQGHDSLLSRFDIDPVEYVDNDLDDLFSDIVTDKKASERLRELNEQIKEEQEAEADSSKPEAGSEEGSEERASEASSEESEHKAEYYTVTLADALGEITIEVTDRIVLNHPWIETEYREDDYDYDQDAVNDFAIDEPLDYQLGAYEGDDRGTRLLQIEYGQGTITALSSTHIWHNSHIGDADHAFFLAYFTESDDELHLYFDVTAPSIVSLINKHFPETVWLLAALLLLWLWNKSLRVQSIRGEQANQRRVFAENLTASAEFLATKKQYAALLKPLSDDISMRMRPIYPGYAQLDEQAQATLLAERTELPAATIQTWVQYTHSIASQAECLDALKLANLISKNINARTYQAS